MYSLIFTQNNDSSNNKILNLSKTRSTSRVRVDKAKVKTIHIKYERMEIWEITWISAVHDAQWNTRFHVEVESSEAQRYS